MITIFYTKTDFIANFHEVGGKMLKHSFVIFLILNTGAYDLEYLGDLPLENPDLFEGDILGIEDPSERNAVVDKRQVWPGGVVPYELDPALSTYESQFLGAYYFYKKDTCIRFVKRTNEKDYIRIFKGQGCYSHVGKTGGAQPLSIGQGCNWMGTVVHELGHAIGFYHEQNRSDRDDYITIYWKNVKEGMADQFFKLTLQQNQLLDTFDYDSIMLYGEYTFSKERGKLKTMVAKKPGVVLKEVVQKYTLSKSDILRINKLYDCKKLYNCKNCK